MKLYDSNDETVNQDKLDEYKNLLESLDKIKPKSNLSLEELSSALEKKPQPVVPNPELSSNIAPQIEEPKKVEQPQELKPLVSKDILDAYENAKGNRLIAALAEAGSQIGAGFARTNFDPNSFKTLKENADRPISDLQSKQKAVEEQQKIELQQKMRDPNSDIAKLTRKIATEMGLPEQDLKNVSPDEMKFYIDQYRKLQEKREASQLRSMQMQNLLDERQQRKDERTNKRFSEFGNKMVEEAASSRSTFGKTANVIRSAESIEKLAEGDLNNLDTRQIAEIARNLDALLSSGQPTISGMKKLIPESASGSASKIEEFLTNIPKGAQQGQFVKKILDTVEREKKLAIEQANKVKEKYKSNYSDLYKQDPERFDSMVNAHIRTTDTKKELPIRKIEYKGKQYYQYSDGRLEEVSE